MQGLRGTWQEMLRCCCGNNLVQSRTERSVWLYPHDQGSDEWHEMRPIKSREPAMKSFKGRGREFDLHFRYTKSPLEEKMAAHSSILAWKILWIGKHGWVQSMGFHRVVHNLVTEHEHI